MTGDRIALVSPYALSVFGGVQEQVLAMSRELRRRGHDVLVVAPDRTDRAPHDTSATVQTFGSLLAVPANGSRAPVTLSWRASREALAAMEEFSPDVVHVHEPFAPLLSYATLRAHRWPTVGTFHRSGGGPAYRLTRPLLRRLSHGLDVACAVSTSAATTIREGAGIDATTLFNGFEMERFCEFPRESLEPPVVLFVGRLEERKGAGILVDAALASGSSTPWRAVIAGDGPQRRDLEARAGHSGRVSFLGAVSDEDKRRWLRRADVLVAPSTHGESFGLVILEAMASSTRTVVSDIDGYRQAAAGCAETFRAGDAGALSEAIERALITRDDATLATARTHASRWSMSALVDQYVTMYETARQRFDRAR